MTSKFKDPGLWIGHVKTAKYDFMDDVRFYEGENWDEDVDDFTWEVVPDFPVRDLVDDVLRTPQDWISWLEEERYDEPRWLEPGTGAELYARDPMAIGPIILTLADGEVHIWDGYHRAAVAHLKGLKTVPAYVGTPKVRSALIRVRGYLYRRAITPKQKEMKKDYLFEQKKAKNALPPWEEVWEVVRGTEAYGFEVSYLNQQEWLTPADFEDIALAHDLIDPDLLEAYNSGEGGYEVDLEYQDAIDDAIQQLKDRGDLDEIIDEKIEEHLEEKHRARYDDIVSQLQYIDGKDVWREITVKDGVNPATLAGVGEYWTYVKEAAEAYEGKPGEDTVRFKARVDVENVDLAGTVYARINLSIGELELEIRFLKHAPIYVYEAEFMSGESEGEVIEINDWRRA